MANCVFYKVWSSGGGGGGECTFPDMHSADRQVHLAKDVPTEDGPTPPKTFRSVMWS